MVQDLGKPTHQHMLFSQSKLEL